MAREAEENALLAPDLMARVRQIQIRTHRLVNDVLSGAYRSTFRGAGIEFEEVRPYLPGDEVRAIDWNRTARAGEPYIKTYVEERELTLQFLVDTSPSMDFGSREFTKRDVAAQFCALLSYVALSQQDQVGLTLFGAAPGLHLPPAKGTGAVARVVREVIAARTTPGAADFGSVLEHQERMLRRRSLVFVVSDFLAPAERSADRRDWVDVLSSLSRRHDLILVRVVDPLEEALPRAGRITLEEIETGRLVQVDSRSRVVRERWAAEAAARREGFYELARRGRTGTIELDAAGDIAEPVIEYFRKRRRRPRGRS